MKKYIKKEPFEIKPSAMFFGTILAFILSGFLSYNIDSTNIPRLFFVGGILCIVIISCTIFILIVSDLQRKKYVEI